MVQFVTTCISLTAPERIWLILAHFQPVCHQPLPCASKLGSKPYGGVKTHFLPGVAQGKLMPISCWLQTLALPTLPAQESRAPGTLNNSLLQPLHSSSSPLPCYTSPCSTQSGDRSTGQMC